MDKFLQLCFKIGKWILSFVLVILFIAGIIFGGLILYKTSKIGSHPIDYKLNREKVLNEMLGNQPGQDSSGTTKNKQETLSQKEQYKAELKKALKDINISDKGINRIANFIDENVAKEDIKPFIQSYPRYHRDVIDLILEQAKKNNPDVTDEMLEKKMEKISVELERGIFDEYSSQYLKELRVRQSEDISLRAQRTILLYAFLITLAIFILFLIVPILIKIEENTRK